MTVADRIRHKRTELNMSQDELAKKAKYSDKTRISKLENSGDEISMKQVKRVAEALGVSSAYLMGWEDENGELTLLGKLGASYKRRMFPDDASNPEADHLYELYQDAPPEIQAAIDTLLGYKKPDA